MSLADPFGLLAEAAFKRAVELAPDGILVHVSYASLLLSLGFIVVVVLAVACSGLKP